MKIGMMFFASSEDAEGGEKYRLVIESARYGDEEGFSSVWVPERHFHLWGCLYPNPSVLQAALARETRRIRLRAGSVVLPLHEVLRVAEEWAMVDNLSGGRVDLSFASGWNPKDFVLSPESYVRRQEELFAGIEQVKRLWRGERVEGRSGDGKRVEVRSYPTPVQKEVPVWVTAAGNPKTFEREGEIGANVLTHLLDQGMEELGNKIKVYREARGRSGHRGAGSVTVMVHTYVGEEKERVKEEVRGPFCQYLKTIAPLLKGVGESRGRKVEIEKLTEKDLEVFVEFIYERLYEERALVGTAESCQRLLGELAGIGVDEVACLLDFGPKSEQVLAHLPYLKKMKDLW